MELNRELEEFVNSQIGRTVHHPLIEKIGEGRLSIEQLRVFAQQFYHFLAEAEYRFSALSVVRSPDLESVKRNLAHAVEEAGHMEHYLRFAGALGLTEQDLEQSEPKPGVFHFANYFYRLSFFATPAEVAAGAGLPEGVFAAQCAAIEQGLLKHYGYSRTEVKFFSLHTVADREHEKLHYWRIERQATTDIMRKKVMRAARLGFQYYVEMFDAILDAVNEQRQQA
jgi:pyrroloquinoline quinone (PQQ) biosynthesis protein C